MLDRVYFIFLFFLICPYITAQKTAYIAGRLLEERTQNPIVFASIRITDRALGVISNEDGSFRIPLRYKEYGDVIEISSMGFLTKKIPINTFLLDTLNTVFLEPAPMALEEAIVFGETKRRNVLKPKEIVQKAIDAILDNYPTTPFTKVGYYRDYQMENGDYINLNEAIIEVFDQGFKAMDSSTTKAVLYEYKENMDFRRDSLAVLPYNYEKRTKIIDKGYLSSYGGNEFVILKVHNAIRNYTVNSYSFVHRFDSDLLNEHEFWKKRDAYTAGKDVYHIGFEKILPNYNAYGELYISKDNYSIYKMTYAVYDTSKLGNFEKPDYARNEKDLMLEVVTEYNSQGDKMFLNFISFHNAFKVREPPKFKLDEVELNWSKGCFVLRFNKELDPTMEQKNSNYKVVFRGKRIKIDCIVLVDDIVRIYPKMNSKKFSEIAMVIEKDLKSAKMLSETSLEVTVKGIKDISGNVINQWSEKNLNQFREFFVQRVKTKPSAVSSEFFMNKNAPIFKDQPMLKPDNFDEYWMNTPLKTIRD
jgi:hypothetical protein